MNARASLALGFGLAGWLAVLPASAAISAQIPEECGSLSEFENELEQRLGNVSEAEGTRVTLTPEISGYHLVVEAGNQRRELHDPSCQELLRAAIVITLALLEPQRAEVAPPAPEAPPEQRAAPASPAVPARGKSRARLEFALGALGGLHVGTLPQATLMLDLDAQLKWTPFGIALGFRYLFPTSTIDDSLHGARIGATGAYLLGLFEPWQRVQTRLGIVTYRLSATGLGSVEPRDGSAWEVGPTLGASFVPFERPPFWTAVGLEGQLNLIRPRFEILSYREVFRVPRLSGSAFAGAGVVF